MQGEDSRNPRALAAFGLAMSLHFLVVDHGLLEYHRAAYRRLGRWILCLAAAVGWAAGSATAVPEAAVAALFAFLAGGIVLNVLKEELPEERRGRYGAFAAGAAGCAALLIAGA